MFEKRATWVEQQIQDAMARGEFDDLPGAGKPIEGIDGDYDENWWVKSWIKREDLDTTAVLPTPLALKKELEELPGRLDRERDESTVRALVTGLNERILEARRRPAAGPAVYVRTVDVDEAVADWRARRSR